LISPENTGLYRYKNWLPVCRTVAHTSFIRTFRSEKLNSFLGLPNLWISFSGYWPERDILLKSGSFKELEAQCVLGRLPIGNERILTLASAGNTAAAFAVSCSTCEIPCIIFIPKAAVPRLRFPFPISPCVQLIAIEPPGDYTDAIMAAEALARSDRYVLEGGARNVARRDGVATVLLNAFETIGSLPEYYFQAIGSGTGAIAVHEAAKRLCRSGDVLPRLYLSQNLPFTPIFDSWNSSSRDWLPFDEIDAKSRISDLFAPVLANRRPPYAVKGGLRQALTESRGTMFAISNKDAAQATHLFENLEGIDLDAASGVALASLQQAVERRMFSSDTLILLNLTGGGLRRLELDYKLYPLHPNFTMSPNVIETPAFLDELSKTLCSIK
jgi:cysteate synthase